MNIVLDEAVEEKTGGEKVRLGMVVRLSENLGNDESMVLIRILRPGYSR
jgi:hypothetical protein